MTEVGNQGHRVPPSQGRSESRRLTADYCRPLSSAAVPWSSPRPLASAHPVSHWPGRCKETLTRCSPAYRLSHTSLAFVNSGSRWVAEPCNPFRPHWPQSLLIRSNLRNGSAHRDPSHLAPTIATTTLAAASHLRDSFVSTDDVRRRPSAYDFRRPQRQPTCRPLVTVQSWRDECPFRPLGARLRGHDGRVQPRPDTTAGVLVRSPKVGVPG